MLWALVAAALAVVAEGARTPNLLFVLADDMGWGDVSYNKEYYQPGAGGKEFQVNPPRTPFIDKWATGENTMLFKRFYSGSAVCSPTRSSVLSGRTPQRDCINSAEGCGQDPAWSCYDKLPFPPTTFTVAEAAKQQGYATTFIGKWHLGDFWLKGEKPANYAQKKWPVSHPGMHGFDEWHATEASAASSTTNCGCMPSWVQEGKGCIVGGGQWERKSLDCTNYWSPTDLDAKHHPSRPECHESKTVARDCVANLTSKIEGDDTDYILDVFEDFLKRKTSEEKAPFLAFLFLHTNHVPHVSLPEWYHAYNGTDGSWAGDYLGTVSQMDAGIGRLQAMLQTYGVADDTMVWFTVDNGAHTSGRPSGQNSASNGLRQCKASLFEGGIREPGFVVWPQAIKEHKETLHPTCTTDFLPTVLDLLGVPYPNTSWTIDGVSVLPLLEGKIPTTTPRAKGMGFAQSGQLAWMNDTGNGVMKMVYSPQRGQCEEMLAPYKEGAKGPFLFNLTADPTESVDLCPSDPVRCAAMKAAMDAFHESITHSAKWESQCMDPALPDPTLLPSPASVEGGFRLVDSQGRCVTMHTEGLKGHGAVALGECTDVNSVWMEGEDGQLVSGAYPSWGVHTDDKCNDDSTVWASPRSATAKLVVADGQLKVAGCAKGVGMTTKDRVIVFTSHALAVSSTRTTTVTRIPL